MEGVKEAVIEIPETKSEFNFLKGVKLRVAVAHGLANAKIIMETLKQCDEKGKPYPWDFIEVMACPGKINTEFNSKTFLQIIIPNIYIVNHVNFS